MLSLPITTLPILALLALALSILALPILALPALAVYVFALPVLAHLRVEPAQLESARPEPARPDQDLLELAHPDRDPLEPAHREPARADRAPPECAQPSDPTPSASPAHNLLSSVDIPGVLRFSKTCMTPSMGISDGQSIQRTVASSHESSRQRIRGPRGDYTVLTHDLPLLNTHGAGEKCRRTKIEMLPEDILLDIFDFYRLDAMWLSRGRPWKWHRLAHVCRKWRYVISISPRRLDLRILCKYGAPVESILGSWPTFPLVIKFDGIRKLKPMPRNILVALRCSDRICDINLSVTSPMTGSIVELIQKPCPVLEKIRLIIKDAMESSTQPAHDNFLGGSAPCLREIELQGIALPFPAIRRVLFSANNLAELHLSDVPNAAYFSPIDLVTALSSLDQLKRLAIGFHSPTSRPAPSIAHRSLRRTALPSITFFDFHGASEYLEELVAQIHLPALCKITIKLFNQIFFEIPKFSQFIRHQNSNVLGSPTLVLVTHTAESVSVFLIQKEDSSPDEYCYMGTSCKRLDWQLSFVTQILSQLFPLLSSVAKLTFITHLEMPTGKEDVDPTQWLELFQLFTHVKEIHVFEQLVPDIVHALAMEAMDIGVLPELTSLSLNGYRKSPTTAEAAEEFVAKRRVSGRTVSLSG